MHRCTHLVGLSLCGSGSRTRSMYQLLGPALYSFLSMCFQCPCMAVYLAAMALFHGHVDCVDASKQLVSDGRGFRTG